MGGGLEEREEETLISYDKFVVDYQQRLVYEVRVAFMSIV